MGGEIAKEWAAEYNYPFQDTTNLSRVAQYVALEENTQEAKRKMVDLLKRSGSPDFTNPNQPHGVVANLPLPIYITTNYDDFMLEALKSCGRKPRPEVCKWHRVRARGSVLDRADDVDADQLDEPTPERPVVFHLHGTWNDEDSMVLTEDDYLDFLIHAHGLLPSWIERAFTDSSLLFMGYSFTDINFKVMFRKIAPYLHISAGKLHVAVQLDPEGDEPTAEERRRAESQRLYMEREFERLSIRIFWGTCEQFASGLRERWESLPHGH